MAGHDDDAIFRARKFGDNVVHQKFAFGRVGGERIVFDRVALQMGEDVLFDFL